MPPQKRAAIAKKGGFAAAKAKAQKKTYSEIARLILEQRLNDDEVQGIVAKYPNLAIGDINVKLMTVLGLTTKAMQGDVNAFEKIQELAPDDIAETETDKKLDLADFESCCELCGYPPPFRKQIEMANFIFSERNEPRLLLGARNYGKTEYAVIVKAAQQIALKGLTIILITKEEARARDLTLEISRCLECLGIKDFKRNSSEVIQLASNASKEPNLKAISLGGKGFRGRHPQLIVLDDPITPEASSKADRDKAKKVYDELLKLCKRVRIIGQPVHKQDLYQITRKKIKTMEVPYGSIPALDIDLQSLRLAGVDEGSINASYFLKVDDVGQMPFSDIEITNAKFDASDGTLASIDPSHEGGDWTAITIAKVHLERILIVGFCFKAAWYDCLNDIAGIIKRFNVRLAYFENNALGQEPIRRLNALGLNCNFIGFKSMDNKEAKIQNAGMFVKTLILSAESNAEYKKQIIDYEAGAQHDDAPDSLANWLINSGWMKAAREKRSK
jgi:hypothetical protein